MMRLLGYTLLGLAAYGFFLLTQSPAALVAGMLAERLPGLTVRQVEGSALYGSAWGIGFPGVRVENLAWRWRPWALATGQMNYRLQLSEPQLRLEGTVGVDLNHRIHIDDLQGRLPVAKLTGLIGPTPLAMTGDLELDVARLRLGENGLPQAAQGTARLLDARSSFPRLALGDFGMTLTTEEDNIVGVIKDEGGPLEFTGTLTLSPEGRYRFLAQIGIRDKTNRELQGILSLLGRPDGDGKWRINLSGTLNA